MKRINVFLIIFLSALLCGCLKDTLLSIDLTSITIPDIGGTQTISLTANKPWTLSSNQAWCRVSPTAGDEASSSIITITCEANTTYDARTCSVTFTCAEKTVTLNVSQAANNGFVVPQTEYNITNAAQQLNIEVKANVKFSVGVDDGCRDWISYNTTKSIATSTIVLDIAENESYDGREGKVTIKQADGNLSATVVIKQGQLDGLFLTTSEYNLSNEKHTLTVEVKSNIDFEVKPEVDWIRYVETKGLNTNQIILDIAENDTYDDREGHVMVKQKNGDLTGTITVKQDEKYGILVSQSEYTLSNEAQTIDVEMKYNVDFEVVIPNDFRDWIKQVSTKSLNDRTYSFSISKNEAYDPREGTISFKQKNGLLSTTVYIKQDQTDILEVDSKEFTVDVEGGTISVNVKSNIGYDIAIAEDAESWISLIETKNPESTKICFNIASCSEDVDRTGVIVISKKDFNHTITVHQYSSEANTIIKFADARVKEKLVEAFDLNGDGELSIREARAVKSIEGAFGEIIPPAYYVEKPYESFDEFQYFTGVTEIPDCMFSVWTNLSSITLPESITAIRAAAFYACRKLTSIILPPNLKYIYGEAFEGAGLTSVTINESVESIGTCAFDCVTTLVVHGSVNIGYHAFGNALTNIFIDDIAEWCNCTIGREPYGLNRSNDLHLFVGGKEVTELIIPNSVTSISSNAFSYFNYITSVVIPNTISTIEFGTFTGCSRLSSVSIPESVSSIQSSAFSGCSSLVSLSIPKSVSYIGSAAFYECTNLKNIVIPSGVTTIELGTFQQCSSLSSVTIPNTVSVIETQAFFHCHSLTTIEIPNSVTLLGNYAFTDCPNLQEIMVLPDTPPSLSSSARPFEKTNNCPIYVPSTKVDTYKSAEGWSEYANRIQAIPE